MKNIVKVLRYKDNAARFYTLPNDVIVGIGVIVTVEFPDRYNTCVGVTVSESYLVDDETAKMIMQFCKMSPAAWNDMKKVVSLYDENPVDWPEDDADEDTEKTDDNAEETEDEE